MSLRRKIIRFFLCVVVLLIVIFCIGSIWLTTPYINGFIGTIGIVRLELSRNDYIEIGNDPILVLVRRDSGFFSVQFVNNEFFDLYFDENIGCGYGIRNGIRYSVLNWTPFTRRYGLIRVEPAQ